MGVFAWLLLAGVMLVIVAILGTTDLLGDLLLALLPEVVHRLLWVVAVVLIAVGWVGVLVAR